MSVNTPEAFRLMNRVADRMAAEYEPSLEELRTAAEANWLRRERKLRVYKVAGSICLTFLICGALLVLAYAFDL